MCRHQLKSMPFIRSTALCWHIMPIFFRDFAFVTSCDITFVYVICKDQLIVLSDLLFLVLYLMHKDLYISAHDFIQGPESFNLILIPPLMKMEQASC